MENFDPINFQAINPDELTAAEQQAENSGSTFTHRFKTPFTYMGTAFTELRFDWDSLTGRDGLDIERELQALGAPAIVPAFSGAYLIRMAAKACAEKIGSDAFELIQLADYNRIRSAARSFFAGVGVVAGDGGSWLRRTCMTVAKNNNTPVDFWLSLPLSRLGGWIKDNNALIKK